ncbi:hypothetical protein [Immundisolibacter sp.]|nr:hypothetical protein [Immundisolibacter sp.]MDD3650062.1 hypothetical protein [Immundisolibacter sp.]
MTDQPVDGGNGQPLLHRVHGGDKPVMVSESIAKSKPRWRSNERLMVP